jgi:hypothetical protein
MEREYERFYAAMQPETKNRETKSATWKRWCQSLHYIGTKYMHLGIPTSLPLNRGGFFLQPQH